MIKRSRFALWLMAFIGLFVFNGLASAQSADTFCYDFNFNNSAFASTFSVNGQYQTDLGTGISYYSPILQSDGTYLLQLRYLPNGGYGFYSRVSKVTLTVSYPSDSVGQVPAAYVRSFGLEAQWNVFPANDLIKIPLSGLNYAQYTQVLGIGSAYNGTLVAEVTNPYGWNNESLIELTNHISGTRLLSARFEGLYSSPFGSSNCEYTSPAPTPTIAATNKPPETPTYTPSPTLTRTPSPTPSSTIPSYTGVSFTFLGSTGSHVDPTTGIDFFVTYINGVTSSTSQGDMGGDAATPLEFSVSTGSADITLSSLSYQIRDTASSSLTQRSSNSLVYLNGATVFSTGNLPYPNVWPVGNFTCWSGVGLCSSFNPLVSYSARTADGWYGLFDPDTDATGSVSVHRITVTYNYNGAATSTPTTTTTPSITPTASITPIATMTSIPTSSPTPTTDSQCTFTNSSFTSGSTGWTTAGTAVLGAIQLTTGQAIAQVKTLAAGTYRLSLTVESLDNASGAGTASFAYTASLGSLSGSLGSFTLTEFQASSNQRTYTNTFTSGAGSSTITATVTLTGSITAVRVSSACLFLSATGTDGSDDSGSGGVFNYQCGETLTTPPLSILAIGEWIIFLAKALLQWFSCILMPIIQNIFNIVNLAWNYMRDLGFFLFSWMISFFVWLTKDFLNWLRGLIVNILNVLLGVIAAVQGVANPLGSILSRIFSIFGLLLSRLFKWLSILTGSVSIVLAAWNASGTSTIGVTLHDCVNRPLESDICAFYYIAENTILAGNIGGLIIPLITAILYTISVLYIVDIVSRFVKDIRAGSK